MIELKAHTGDGRTEIVALTEMGSVRQYHVHVEFTPVFNGADIDKVSLSVPFSSVSDIDVIFERQCTPENPFYVRWINDNGGYNYQMFAERHVLTRSVKGIETFNPIIDDTLAANATMETMDLTASDTIKVGVDQITKRQFDVLSKLAFSPKIERYNLTQKRWQRINLSGNQKNEWQNGTPLGAIEYNFELPQPQTQF